jgi:hypothetical protein
MKKALIATNEPRENGYRVAQIVNSENETFETSPALMWVDCPDDLEADQKWFDPRDNTFKDLPIKESPYLADNQPTTTGTQTI